ncbi:MAG: aromatic ring hydroxylase, partial [Streptococcus mitis]|nr:aromatic ring hydroxylase [Streptococcus mitis]
MRDDIKINDRALALQDQIIEKLEKVFDTDVELDVYNLGLIYEINLDETGLCKIVMTFTDTAGDQVTSTLTSSIPSIC